MTDSRNSLKCVIVEPRPLVLDLLAAAVGGVPGVEIVATATDLADSDRLASLLRVDLLIVACRVCSGDGVDVVRHVRAHHPGMKCIVLGGTTPFTCPGDLLDVVTCILDEASGSETLFAAIVRLVDGSPHVSREAYSAAALEKRLTAREWQLFTALGDGLSNKELGTRLGISLRTVETHRKSIARKLGLSGSALVRLAVLQRRGPGYAQPFSDLPENILSLDGE